MPRVSRFDLPPLDFGGQSLGERLARLRQERGLSQAGLARRVGIIQALVSDYERDCLKLSAEMAVRFAQALQIGVEELLETRQTPATLPANLAVIPGADRRTKAGAGAAPQDLTPREAEVFGYLQRRWRDPEMAQEMNVSRSTVKCYVAKVIEKTGVSSRHELALDKPRPRLEPLRRRA